MKVAICMLNSKFIHSSLAPWCLLAGVNAYCDSSITAKVIEGTVNEKTDVLADRILRDKPDAIALCCYIWNINTVFELCGIIRRRSDAKIILGGPEVSYNPRSVLENNSEVDFVLCGEGEESFATLCRKLSGEAAVVNGLCFREKGEITVSPPVRSCNEPVSPYTKEYFRSLSGRIAYIETSRGCPFSCAFCLSGTDKGVVFFDTDRVKNEIIALANSGTQTVKFIDRTFNASTGRANEIISFIIENYGRKIPENVCFHFEIDGGTLKDSTLDLLSTAPAGLFQLEVGLQSVNRKTLEAVNRNPDTGKLTDNIKKLVSFGNMHIHADLIAGLPHEDLESFRKSFNQLYTLRPHMLQLGFLKLLHGSQLRENCDKFGCEFNAHAPYEVVSTDCLDRDDMRLIHYSEDALDRLYNSNRLPMTLDYLVKDCGAEPFDLFCEIGRYTGCVSNMPLDEYLALVYNFLSEKYDRNIIRDYMVCDRLASNSSGVLPAFLKTEDKQLKRIKKHIVENVVRSEGKVSVAILYTMKKIVYCDYKEQDRITGNYKLSFMEWNVL